MTVENKSLYVTASEAAKLLGFTPDYIRRLIWTKKIRAEKLGANWIINKKELKKITRQRFPRQSKEIAEDGSSK